MYSILDCYSAALAGFKCANRWHSGCLTEDSTVRLHSCEKGTGCTLVQEKGLNEEPRVVWIIPILTRTTHGDIVPELGAGGGGTDLQKSHVVELNDPATTLQLMQLCSDKIVDKGARARALRNISKAASSPSRSIDLSNLDISILKDELSLGQLLALLALLNEDEHAGLCERGSMEGTKYSAASGAPRKILLPDKIVSLSLRSK